MLRTTEQLLAADRNHAWRSAAVHTIRRHGTAADAAAVLPAFLADPAGNDDLLPILAEHGDTATAEALLGACFSDGVLKPDVAEEVLHLVGYLGYEPATRLLWNHVGVDNDYYQGYNACLGLVHLPCTELADEIDAALRQHHFRNLFPEYLPALAAKVGDAGWPERLYDWGSRGNGFGYPGASTDCNGGLLLGLALSGATELFERALWSSHWECHSGSTGTVRAAYRGLRVLGTPARVLLDQAVAPRDDVLDRAAAVLVLAGVLHRQLGGGWLGLRMAKPPAETAADLQTLVADARLAEVARAIIADARAQGISHFDPFNPLERLTGVVHRLETALADAVAHEVELAEVRSWS